MSYLGETAAIMVSLLWTAGALFFTSAGKRIGSFSVNLYRIIISAFFLCITHQIFFGIPFPLASLEQWIWLGLSGVIAMGIGDYCLFSSFVIIGPRLTVLILAMSPIFASLGALVLLGEILYPIALLGIAVTLIGIVIVLRDKKDDKEQGNISKNLKWKGVFLSLIASIGQGIGIVLAKKGMNINPNQLIDPLSATFIRIIMAGVFVWIMALGTGKLSELNNGLRNKIGMELTLGGAFFGAFLGITLSMIAVKHAETGVAQTLMSLRPIIILPVIHILYKNPISAREIIGAAITVCGVAILFLN